MLQHPLRQGLVNPVGTRCLDEIIDPGYVPLMKGTIE